MNITLKSLLLAALIPLSVDAKSAVAQNGVQQRTLSLPERLLVGRWQGNEQKYKNGWKQADFYLFANDGTYVVAIRIFDPVEKKWRKRAIFDKNDDDGFDGIFYVVKDKTLILDNWFAPRELELQIKGTELILRRPTLDSTWTMSRVKRFEWEDSNMTTILDKLTVPAVTKPENEIPGKTSIPPLTPEPQQAAASPK